MVEYGDRYIGVSAKEHIRKQFLEVKDINNIILIYTRGNKKNKFL